MPQKIIKEGITNLSQLQIEDGVIYDDDGKDLYIGFSKARVSSGTVLPSPTANVYGTPILLFSGRSLIFSSLKVVVSGTFGGSETFTLALRATDQTGVVREKTINFTATGTNRYSWGASAEVFEALVANNVYIVRLEALARSNINSSSVSAAITFNFYGS